MVKLFVLVEAETFGVTAQPLPNKANAVSIKTPNVKKIILVFIAALLFCKRLFPAVCLRFSVR